MFANLKTISYGLLLALLGVALLAPAAGAQDNADQKQGVYNIRVVDMQVLLQQYKKRQEKYDELQKQVDDMQKDIDALSAKIEANKDKYEKQADQMTEDQRVELRNTIESDYAEYQTQLKQRQRQIDSMEEKVLKEVIGDIKASVEKIATSKNYHLILNAQGGGGSVIYYSPTIDITSTVLEDLNSQ